MIGGGKGIGLQVCTAFAEAGAEVSIKILPIPTRFHKQDNSKNLSSAY